jgi:UDP-N-acetylmuramate--alanine ligase
MNLNDVKIAYFLGIGGIGMSAIARYFKAIGIDVKGYDKTRNDFTFQLEKEGFDVHYFEDIQAIPEAVYHSRSAIVIYTPAIPKDNKEYLHLLDKQVKLYKRAEVLGMISANAYTIAIAGTHGKTTTSSMIANILNENGINFTAFLGGITNNFNSNYYHKTDGINLFEKQIMVLEADEFDRSFLYLNPDLAVVTSTDADHLDVYGQAEEVQKSFQEFVDCIKESGTAIIRENLNLKFNGHTIRYGADPSNAARYSTIRIENNHFCFKYQYANINSEIINALPGFHNVENACAAITVANVLALPIKFTIKACATFAGVRRRFEFVVKREDAVVIDDYAHHPTELKAAIQSVRELYPDRQLTGVFQPHLYSRTRDFADDFAKALDLLDVCWLMDIYPAREQPIEGINSEFLALKMNKSAHLISKENIIKKVEEERPELLLIMGAGDIDQIVNPIKLIYEKAG